MWCCGVAVVLLWCCCDVSVVWFCSSETMLLHWCCVVLLQKSNFKFLNDLIFLSFNVGRRIVMRSFLHPMPLPTINGQTVSNFKSCYRCDKGFLLENVALMFSFSIKTLSFDYVFLSLHLHICLAQSICSSAHTCGRPFIRPYYDAFVYIIQCRHH